VTGRTDRLRFTPDSAEVTLLSIADPRMASLIAAVGTVDVRLTGDRFVSLARAIVGQQLSTKAASTIWSRFAALGPVSPADILALDEADMRSAGLSRNKVAYLHDLAEKATSGEVDLDAIDALDDDGVVAEVTRVKGIGRWTGEMFLIFSLGRRDVLAVDDGGLLRSAGWLLELGGPADASTLAAAGEIWRPVRTVASLFLWAALDKGLVPRHSRAL
jgi:DNA-3-methyladenine glycosylase II